MANKIITLTGGDCCGKATQAALLRAALGPGTTLMSFPEYDRPIGRMLKALYRDEEIAVAGRNYAGTCFGGGRCYDYSGCMVGTQPRDPMYIQLLNTLARVEAQGRIGEALRQGHVVMDRYDADTFLYGAAQGVHLKHLAALDDMLTYGSDFVFYLYGANYSRGGKQDINERNRTLQGAVARNCIAMRDLYPKRSFAMDVGLYRYPHCRITSIERIHQAICTVLRHCEVVDVWPLCQERIEHLVELSDQEKEEALA